MRIENPIRAWLPAREATRGAVIDVAGIDLRGRRRPRRPPSPPSPRTPRPSRRDNRSMPASSAAVDIAGVVEGLVATELMRKALLLHPAERDAGDGRSDQRRGNAVRGLRRPQPRELGVNRMTKAATMMMPAAIRNDVRLAVVLSMSAPAGVVATMPARPPIVITIPISAGDQLCFEGKRRGRGRVRRAHPP